MAWSYRKRIKVIPGVHLNISKRGISTSIGVKGASINFSKSGTRLNTHVLGFSNSFQLSGSNSRSKSRSNLNLSPVQPSQPNVNIPVFFEDTIFSADVHEITSQNMQGIKEAIILAQKQKAELTADLKKIKRTLSFTKTKKILGYLFIYGLINKNIIPQLNTDITAQQEAIDSTNDIIEKCYVNLEVDFDNDIRSKFEDVYECFKKLTGSKKIWDITSAHFQDRVAARSSASKLVSRKEVKFSLKSLPYIKSDYPALYLKNANGADLYFYPTFVVMYTNDNHFGIIGIDELKLYHSSLRFTEESEVPADTKIIDRTWAKVNKNGTRDKRFKSNYQIPVVRYGHIKMNTDTGLNEEYQFSNYELAEQFGKAFKIYQSEFLSKVF
ncbi:DUF4236 domain-containing protein [Chryseobacterium vrystaatense]|uniref:DUF4236 domain-containing protein n=1 Tax=Chryseobacterium vrystaatense TaxID=307480 RepID=A0ABR4UH14_9FLAO|nr:DUF4236 domain-containing protein [Chryseobacterium vrystaatense]KFF23729.1 hypothetical protein IW16_26230 [Chryseobacterium vrystaatense]